MSVCISCRLLLPGGSGVGGAFVCAAGQYGLGACPGHLGSAEHERRGAKEEAADTNVV